MITRPEYTAFIIRALLRELDKIYATEDERSDAWHMAYKYIETVENRFHEELNKHIKVEGDE